MGLVSENIKYLRKKIGLTQEQMAERLGIKRSLLGAYEEGRADPRIANLVKFSEIFNITVDQIIGSDMTNPYDETPEKATGAPGQGLKVLSITVDKQDKENIELVPQKAAAGYLNGYADPEYIEELPRFQLPMLPGNATYRAFEVSGDSMLPLLEGTVVIGKYVENVRDIRDGKTYVLLTNKEGVVYKRVLLYDNDETRLRLVSDNQAYAPYDLMTSELLEIWEVKAYISMELPTPGESDILSLKKLAGIVLDLQQEVIKLKDK
jgi:transcriptional regulator with XRE-family HTH domain